MSRHRDRKSATGLLPLMESRPRKDGLITYRYHPRGANPINLGTDRDEAIRKVLDLNRRTTDYGTVNELWRAYRATADWERLGERTKIDYADCSVPLLKVFGSVAAFTIRPPHVARYLRTERKDAPIRANREVAVLSNLMNLAVERGDIPANPCKQVRRNRESARTKMPNEVVLKNFIEWLRLRGRQWIVIAAMAEFAARAGSRRAEFLKAEWSQISGNTMRLLRAKQRDGAEVWDSIELSEELRLMLNSLPRKGEHTYLFQTRTGNAYTESGFKGMWNKAVTMAMADGVFTREERFTFHDLRAFYTTGHKAKFGNLPDLHANVATTAKVYERSGVKRRVAL